MTVESSDKTESRPPASEMLDALDGLGLEICKLAAAARLLDEALGQCERDAEAIEYLADEILDRATALIRSCEKAQQQAIADRAATAALRRQALRTVPTAGLRP